MFLSKLFERRGNLNNPRVSIADADDWDMFGVEAESGERVSTKRALSIAPVWQAVKMISGDCSKLPLKVYKRQETGKTVDRQHQSHAWINRHGKANADCSALKLWRRHFAAACLFENSYIWIDRDSTGRIHGLYNLLPDRTAPMRHKGKLWYVTEVDGKLEPLPASEVIHLEGLCWDGQTAPALVTQGRHDFGVSLAARKFTSKFFANNAHAGGVLQVPPGYKPETRKKIERAMQEQRSGTDKAFKTMVLRDGYKWFSTQVDPDKAKLIDLDEQQVRHVARWFMLHPSRLGVTDTVSYNSLEAAKLDYHDTTLSYWLTGNQAECSCKLLTEQEQRESSHVIEYEINALLWADSKTRNEIAVSGIQSGRFSPDETRAWENMNARPDGKGGKFLQPLNMTTGDDGSDDDDNDETIRSAHRELLARSLRRVVRRIKTSAERSAKDADRWQVWRAEFREKQLATCTDMIEAELAAVQSVLRDARQTSGQEVVENLLVEIDRRTAIIDAGSVSAMFADLESEYVDNLVDDLMSREDAKKGQ